MKKYWFLSAIVLLTVLCAAALAEAAPVSALNMTKFLFADEVTGLSQYTPKQDSRFVTGDQCIIYIEAAGFALKPVQPDSEDEFELDLAVDMTIKMPQRPLRRSVIVSEKDFNTLKTIVRSELPATFLAFAFVFDDEWDTGNYMMEITLRDNLSGQSVTQEAAFLIDVPTEADLARQAGRNNQQQAPQAQ